MPDYVFKVILWNVIIEYCFHIINVNSSRSNICSNQDLHTSGAECFHDTVTLCLLHIAVKPLCHITAAL